MTPLLALFVVAVGGVCLQLGRLGGVANARAKAQVAADAAALAGAADGEDAARELAAANGAEVVAIEAEGDDLQVEVRIGEVEAVARARDERPSDGSVATAAGLVPELAAALRQAAALLGAPVPITSGWRSEAAQRQLYEHRATNPYPVAPPGTSMHERGRAVDVPPTFAARLAVVARRVGLCRPWPDTDPVHFELCGG